MVSAQNRLGNGPTNLIQSGNSGKNPHQGGNLALPWLSYWCHPVIRKQVIQSVDRRLTLKTPEQRGLNYYLVNLQTKNISRVFNYLIYVCKSMHLSTGYFYGKFWIFFEVLKLDPAIVILQTFLDVKNPFFTTVPVDLRWFLFTLNYEKSSWINSRTFTECLKFRKNNSDETE